MYCNNCGCELSENAKFCGKCGTTVKQNNVRDEMKSDGQNGQSVYRPQYEQMQPGYQNPQYGQMQPGYQNPQYGQMQPGYQNPQYGQMQPGYQSPQGFPENNGISNVAHAAGNVAGGVARQAGNVAGGVVRQAGRAKRNMLLALLVVGVFAILFLLYTVFLKTGTPEDTIAKLEKGMNNLDQEMVLECFDDQMNSLYSGSLGLLDSLSGLPISDLADVASGLGGLLSASGMSPTVSIDIEEIEYSADKKSCMAYVLIEMEYMGETQTEYMELPMVLDGREWLISMSDIYSFYY